MAQITYNSLQKTDKENVHILLCGIAELKDQLKAMTSRNAILRQRPDLPVDRIPAIAEMDKLRSRVKVLQDVLREAATLIGDAANEEHGCDSCSGQSAQKVLEDTDSV